MHARHIRTALLCAAMAAASLAPLRGLEQQPSAPLVDQTVPKDLKPLLASPQSEMRLVVLRYTADRATLNGNYQDGRGGGRGGRGGPGGGRGAAAADPATPAAVNLSTNRIARLKRFEVDWQAALANLDASRFTDAAKADRASLQATLAANQQQLDADTQAIAAVMPTVPFAPPLIRLLETRRSLQDVDSKAAAALLTDLVQQIDAAQLKTTALPKDLAQRSAATVDSLRDSLTTWFNFYNGYDPLFTWWMGMPYKQADDALRGYAAFLREKVPEGSAPPTQPLTIDAAPAPRFAEVPDLAELIALPQDEMIPVVQRFIGDTGGGRGATNSPGGGRPRQYDVDWLAALKTLDFDRLSRNAQVDYLFIRNQAERQIDRFDAPVDANPPRKTDDTGIAGAARGRLGLVQDLGDEMIPYSPEQLIALAEKEFEWYEAEMKKASRAMGFGDDWKKAVEKVKEMYVPPGGQPAMVRDLLFEAIDFVRAKDLITVPQVAAESLRMSMMSPEAQLSNPFFLGGAQIIVSYLTNTMEYDARLQSMRGNNIPFSHATAFHEMIPGHNLVAYVGTRSAGYRARIGGSTPFFGEGWPLYWELLMYDLGFHATPEQKVGALFWRMHRCARIIFSLKFHMGQWSPKECIDFLVDCVGHERDNATAEVRRSFQGGYGPLYQAAYLLGGLQLRGLRREVVDSGQMTNRRFHDEILRQGSMPIALIRLGLTKERLRRDMPMDWKFYGDVSPKQ